MPPSPSTSSSTDTPMGHVQAQSGHAPSRLPGMRVRSIPVRVHWSLWLVVGLFALEGAAWGAGGIAAVLLWVGLVFGSVLAHEFGHALVARRRGARVHAITLFALGGVTQAEGLDDRPRDELLLTAAGPAVSLGLAAVGAVAAVGLGVPLMPLDMHGGSLLAQLVWLNLLLGTFNLLPAFPMDGGRLLRAGLTLRVGPERATRIAANVGRVVAGAMVVGGLMVGSFWLAAIGVFVLVGASAEQRQAELARLLAGATAGEATDRTVPLVRVGTRRHHAMSLAPAGEAPMLVLATDGRLGVTTGARLVHAGPAVGEEVADFDVPVIDATAPLATAAAQLAAGWTAMPVTSAGVILGVLTRDSLASFRERAGPARRSSRVGPSDRARA